MLATECFEIVALAAGRFIEPSGVVSASENADSAVISEKMSIETGDRLLGVLIDEIEQKEASIAASAVCRAFALEAIGVHENWQR